VIFVAYWFVIFAICLLPLYWAARHPYLRMAILALGCIVFHFHFAGPAGVVPIIVLAIATYVAGLTRRAAACVLVIGLCTTALVFYKYTHFLSLQLIGSISPSIGQAIDANASAILPGAPPLGISFFVFEFVHYLLEVRKGHKPITNPVHFGLFAIFWPSIVAGPIKRYRQFVPELLNGLTSVSSRDITPGMVRVVSGLIKKTLADNLTMWITAVGPVYSDLHIYTRWLVLFGLAFRIYWDFSGYSDMAIGYSQMLGIRLPENFNWPYVSRDIGEFWRRWHMSLSSWIRDYIYIPLGGNRHGVPRKILNGFVAFGLCGLWHGADWNFLVWGLYHGAGLVINANYEHALGPLGARIAAVYRRAPALGIVSTFMFVCVGWLLFFYQVPVALRMLRLLLVP
jgi:alginate O-acetyltransferase complex protein AlgI